MMLEQLLEASIILSKDDTESLKRVIVSSLLSGN